MKKTLKILLPMIAVMVMVLAMGVAVSAAETTVTAPKKYYGNESAVTKNYSYTESSVLSDSECGIIVPVYVSEKGTIKFSVNYTKLEHTAYIEAYRDAECNNRMSLSNVTKIGTSGQEGYLEVSSAGTYYFRFCTIRFSFDETYTNAFSLSLCAYTESDKTIKSGETINYYRKSGNDQFYFKYKAEKTGKVTVNLPYQYGSYVTLTNAKKAVISETEWVSDAVNANQFSFAVKKGTTYYFLVSSNGVSGGNIQSISVKNTAVKEKSGAKKKKAVAVKAKKKVKGTIVAGSKTADWYKFSVKKKKKVTMQFDTEVSGGITITVYTKGGKKVGSYISYGGSHTLSLTYSTTYGKVNKGTYYIKISRNNAQSSGIYNLKWK